MAAETILVFPQLGRAPYILTGAQIEHWKRVYPGVEVAAECAHAWEWLDANPPGKKNVKRFLVNWLKSAYSRRPPMKPLAPPAEKTPNDPLREWRFNRQGMLAAALRKDGYSTPTALNAAYRALAEFDAIPADDTDTKPIFWRPSQELLDRAKAIVVKFGS